MKLSDINRDIAILNSGNIPPEWTPEHISLIIAEREKKFLQEAGMPDEKSQSLMREQDEEYEKALREEEERFSLEEETRVRNEHAIRLSAKKEAIHKAERSQNEGVIFAKRSKTRVHNFGENIESKVEPLPCPEEAEPLPSREELRRLRELYYTKNS